MKRPKRYFQNCVTATLLCTAILPTSAFSEIKAPGTRLYWGDTHLHTNMSLDAFGGGNTALDPVSAYRFATGYPVFASSGELVRIQRPLDFLVVADHAENLGVMEAIAARDPRLLETEIGRQWAQRLNDNFINPSTILRQSDRSRFEAVMDSIFKGGAASYFFAGFSRSSERRGDSVFGTGEIAGDQFRRTTWRRVTQLADVYNNPGEFTTFIGFEWTSRGENNGNLHRVVVFRDNSEMVEQVLPYSSFDSKNPSGLWSYLENYVRSTGGDALAIPHNGNLSNGEMFSLEQFSGRPIDKGYAEIRARWEPLYEITQMKGDGETHPLLSTTDEFADFDTWNSWKGRLELETDRTGRVKRKEKEYARSAWKNGLSMEFAIGANPFKFGVIGSTDSHTSLSAIDEFDFMGKGAMLEPSPFRLLRQQPISQEASAAGFAAVWATENTRSAIFDAMKRKETYATTGPRMTVRFFGGWQFQKQDAFAADVAGLGYSKGVPMGGDLTSAPQGLSPSFLIRAVKDPIGANLDRVQVVKGWRSSDGQLHEKVYDVALSDGRHVELNGKAPQVGSTVNVSDASYNNSIGDSELAVVWRDPDFNRNELAFYYLRVLEIPTPRWTAYDAKRFKLENVPTAIPMVIQERAYTSPIWYTPSRATLEAFSR